MANRDEKQNNKKKQEWEKSTSERNGMGKSASSKEGKSEKECSKCHKDACGKCC